MSNKSAMKNLSEARRTLAQQLHALRISRRLTIDEVRIKTGIPGLFSICPKINPLNHL